MTKNEVKDKKHSEAELLLLESFSLSSPTLSFKNNRRYSKKCTKMYEVIRLMEMKMRVKMKNILHRYDLKRPRSRNGHKYTKYKMSLSIMIVVNIKQNT